MDKQTLIATGTMLQALEAQIQLTRKQPSEALIIFRDLATALGLWQVVAIVDGELKRRARQQPRLALVKNHTPAGAAPAGKGE